MGIGEHRTPQQTARAEHTGGDAAPFGHPRPRLPKTVIGGAVLVRGGPQNAGAWLPVGGDAAVDRGEQPVTVAAGLVAAQPSLSEHCQALRRVFGDRDQAFVARDSLRGYVLATSDPLALLPDGTQNGTSSIVEASEAFGCGPGAAVVTGALDDRRKLLLVPVMPAGFLQTPLELRPQRRKVYDVLRRVGDHLLVERSSRPVGPLQPLFVRVESHSEYLRKECAESGWQAQQGCRDRGVRHTSRSDLQGFERPKVVLERVEDHESPGEEAVEGAELVERDPIDEHTASPRADLYKRSGLEIALAVGPLDVDSDHWLINQVECCAES